MDYITTVREKTNLKEGKVFIEKFLLLLLIDGNTSTKLLARELKLPIPVATAIKKELIKLGLVEESRGVGLTARGREYLENSCGYGGLDIELYKKLMINDDYCDEFTNTMANRYEQIYANRPEVDVTIDQAKGTPKTAFKRALLCLRTYSLIGKKILCVGDDDLVSVAIALLGKELFSGGNINTEVCVFDIDERYIEYINNVAAKHNLPVSCVAVDLKDSLPISYANNFDSFFTDPPYTLEGLSLFMSRGITALKKEKGLSVFLSFGIKPVEETHDFQSLIMRHGFAIKNIQAGFNIYEGGSLLGNMSQMITLETTENISPIIKGSYSGRLYTREQKAPNSTYICKQCRQKFEFGKADCGEIQTIQQLKAKGCPQCGGKAFDLKKKAAPHVSLDRTQSLGVHIIADFFECEPSILKDMQTIKNCMHSAAEKAKATIVSEEFHEFNPHGVSGAIIIKESHFTIHTWPEYNYAAVDIFTCGDSLDLWSALEFLKESLKSKNMEYNDIARGLLRSGKIFPKQI